MRRMAFGDDGDGPEANRRLKRCNAEWRCRMSCLRMPWKKVAKAISTTRDGQEAFEEGR